MPQKPTARRPSPVSRHFRLAGVALAVALGFAAGPAPADDLADGLAGLFDAPVADDVPASLFQAAEPTPLGVEDIPVLVTLDVEDRRDDGVVSVRRFLAAGTDSQPLTLASTRTRLYGPYPRRLSEPSACYTQYDVEDAFLAEGMSVSVRPVPFGSTGSLASRFLLVASVSETSLEAMDSAVAGYGASVDLPSVERRGFSKSLIADNGQMVVIGTLRLRPPSAAERFLERPAAAPRTAPGSSESRSSGVPADIAWTRTYRVRVDALTAQAPPPVP